MYSFCFSDHLNWKQTINIALQFARLLENLHSDDLQYLVRNISAAHIMIDKVHYLLMNLFSIHLFLQHATNVSKDSMLLFDVGLEFCVVRFIDANWWPFRGCAEWVDLGLTWLYRSLSDLQREVTR